MAIYVFDLDGTLCQTERNIGGFWEYKLSTPFKDRILKVNELFDSGNTIIIETARGCNSGEDWTEFTYNQLLSWGLRFHTIRAGVKFAADFYIDDKALNSEEYFSGSNINTY